MTKKKQQQPSPATMAESNEQEYAGFVQGLQLFSLALKSCHADIDHEAYFSLDKQVKIFTHKYRVTYIDEKCFDAEGDFELSISKSEDVAPAMKINCAFTVHMHGDSVVSAEYADRFASSELRLILVPHARQFFFVMSGQMAIPPIMLPLTTRGITERPKKHRKERHIAAQKD